MDSSLHSQLSQYQAQQDSRSVSINNGEQHSMREARQQELARPGQKRQHTSFQLSWDDEHDPFAITSPKTNEPESLVLFKQTLHDDHDDPLGMFLTGGSKQNLTINDICFIPSGCEATDMEMITALSQPTSAQQSDGFHNAFGKGGQHMTDNDSSLEWVANEHEEMFLETPTSDAEALRQMLNVGESLDMHSQPGWIHRNQSLVEHPHPHHIQRPRTPPNQMSFSNSGEDLLPRTSRETFSGHLPVTPATTPCSQGSKLESRRWSRTAQSSPVRRPRNDTIKASGAQPMKRGSSCQDSYMTPSKKELPQTFPSPPNTAPMKCSRTFEVAPIPPPNFMDMSDMKFSFPKNDQGYESSYYSPSSSRVSPTMSSFQSSPELVHLDLFPNLEGSVPGANQQPIVQNFGELDDFMGAGVHSSPLQPSQPSSPSKDTSHTSFGGVIESKGITAEEIASFIEGPDVENKYRCRYPECDKKFGRKENIRAHVQTHLGDRQFQCEYCPKRFVRQHDLKRHGKTHTNAREYQCACGGAFARHDALTRHRQRGMCKGAFPNTPRKEAKRGRPKKGTRPDTPERLEKAARTRQRVLEKAANAPSPASSSDYSLPSPAAETFQDIDMRGSSPFDNMPEMNPMSYGVSPDIFSLTPPTSPGYSTGNSPPKVDFPVLFDEASSLVWGGEDFSTPGHDPFIWDGSA